MKTGFEYRIFLNFIEFWRVNLIKKNTWFFNFIISNKQIYIFILKDVRLPYAQWDMPSMNKDSNVSQKCLAYRHFSLLYNPNLVQVWFE